MINFEFEGHMENDEIDLKGIFGLLRRQFKLLIYTVILVSGLAVAYLFSITPIYSASALIFVNPKQQNLLNPETLYGGSSDNARLDSEVEILKSDAVALLVLEQESLISDPEFGLTLSLKDKALRALGFAPSEDKTGEGVLKQLVERFKSAVTVSRKGSTYLISVAVSSEDPSRAASLTNALTKAYLKNQLETKITTSFIARDILQARIDVARSALSASDQAFDNFIEDNMAQIERDSGRADITNLRVMLEGIERDSLVIEVIANQVGKDLEARNWAELANSLQNDALKELQSQRADLARQLAGAPAGSQQDVDLKNGLSALDASLEAAVRSNLNGLRVEVSKLESNATDLRAQIRNSVLESQLPSDILAEIYEIQQESTIARNQYQTLLSRLRDVETQASLLIADSRIVSPALVPIVPVSPNKKMGLALSLVIAISLGVGLAFVNEFYIGGFTSASQLQDVLHLPVATIIPYTSDNQSSPANKLVDASLSVYSEAIRRLRAAIDQSLRKRASEERAEHEGGKVVLVTSTVPSEGKSTTAISLGRAYALSGKRTLLIDGDLRKPSVHKFMGVEPKTSLLDYLKDNNRSGIPVEDCYGKDTETDLEVLMGSGRSDVPTDQLLVSKAFESLISGARDVFDVIIVDSSPLLLIVDAQYIAYHADAIVLVVHWAKTNQGDVRSIMPVLIESKKPSAAILPVLSQLEGGKAVGYSGYYSGYGERTY
jgi:capsular exopolysaccharide synthesis family protein